MTNIVSIDTHPARLRPGEMALHAEYGWVEILERAGSRRRIRWIERPPVSSELPRTEVDHAGDVSMESPAVWEDWVDGNALKGTSRPLPASGRRAAVPPAILPRRTTAPEG
ncbi:hypothetical protein GPA22_00930 [Aromatoleum toluvorans]|uniref:Uncharacterized protein n=1 Tax=Aromatoleum toluvorans TaxID=92002 RepID=A0ABX1PS76_9RHOO|nr:hypothetical protein [Aromatoleum toluvorans]NMG42301.1 hypothetical protein [Aromatoleum toluvorans]